jgi:hypothetical protein
MEECTTAVVLLLGLCTALCSGYVPGQRSRYSDSLQARRCAGCITTGARFSAPNRTRHGAHPAPCTMGIASLFQR